MSGSRRRAGRVADHPVSGDGPTLYLESSAVVASLIEGDAAAMTAIRQARTAASALTFAEARRSLLRATLSGRLSGEEVAIAETELRRIESGCMILGVDDLILARAGRRYPMEPVRTLDAIHLATAERIDDPAAPITILTRDARIRENSVLLGMRVV
ncbi:MAG: type II toxin-antitoxin system VapC family toxin [Gemmatimonadales bacterium]|nr:type II toxin-antitoxin system VapC family toxin [Gemmatimonadales bacterium]MDZ4388319.1 type II toxin-antitoxin system VapC family toxin [Gemmatimonadales bacterium]